MELLPGPMTTSKACSAMQDSIDEYFKVKQNCYDDMIVLRKAWGYTSFTIEMAGHAYKTLTIMWLYCPIEIQYIVQATLSELQRRCELMDMYNYREYYNLQECTDET